MLEQMSGHENVVGGKLRLKGKALTVKEGLLKKNKKKKHKHHYDQEIQSGGISSDPNENRLEDEDYQQMHDDYLTPVEKIRTPPVIKDSQQITS
ncbi:uncharacterized protein LOC120257537 isoform X2 [Dioscorea cayenensis subsp. rotundata]|uniref:Uncharacterized protein LOC120257537 isoform X2 n=1 Tax=Dioscorea cayennensis subsp. rotundata TaxID=55577 RepID=A0AB40B0K7_DIOCR|nr:uncharacterized protein LOC120257537 isoform X2 [Dioscorea cayenensis subsp. rotundata]